MDTDKLPSLSALRAFEAAARLASFQEAAAAIRLTPSAVSHQIRGLEIEMGEPLFRRRRRGVELTASGARLQAYVHRAFNEISRGLAAVRAEGEAHVLRISAAPAFAQAFLAGELTGLQSGGVAAYDIRLDATNNVSDLDNGEIDVAIRCVRKPPPDLWSEEVLPITSGPVCAPHLAAAFLADPASAVSISYGQDRGAWQSWARVAGWAEPPSRSKLTFDTLGGAIQAAIEGHGVAILPFALVRAHFDAGRLVRPSPKTLQSGFSYWVLCRRGEQALPKIARFRRWLNTRLADTWRPDAPG